MSKPITALGFNGMNNLLRVPGKLLDDKKLITPQIILNAIVTDGGVLKPRGGYVSQQNLAGLHSLWGGSVMLGVAAGVLYRFEGKQAIPLGQVASPRAPLAYVEIDNLVFMGNAYWQGILDLATMTLESWGVSLPAAPSFSMVSGDLSPGRYSLCFTRVEHGRISGNGPVVQVTWEGQTQGIRLNNLPAGGQCWITQPDGRELFLAQVVNGQIVGQVPQAKPLPTFAVTPPPGFSHFCQAFGRIWGLARKKIHYSDPFQYDWFRGKYLPFLEDLVLVAPVNEGLFVNSLNSTWFLAGTEPSKMAMARVGDGAIPGTLTFAQQPGSVAAGGLDASRPKSQIPSPVWMSPSGFVVGTHTGHLTHLAAHRLRINPRSQGASFYRMREGAPQIISSLAGHPIRDDIDAELSATFTRGRMFVSEPLKITTAGGVIVGG